MEFSLCHEHDKICFRSSCLLIKEKKKYPRCPNWIGDILSIGSLFLFFSLFSSLAFDRSFFTRLDSDPFPLSIIYSYISVYFACNSFEIGKKIEIGFRRVCFGSIWGKLVFEIYIYVYICNSKGVGFLKRSVSLCFGR